MNLKRADAVTPSTAFDQSKLGKSRASSQCLPIPPVLRVKTLWLITASILPSIATSPSMIQFEQRWTKRRVLVLDSFTRQSAVIRPQSVARHQTMQDKTENNVTTKPCASQ